MESSKFLRWGFLTLLHWLGNYDKKLVFVTKYNDISFLEEELDLKIQNGVRRRSRK